LTVWASFKAREPVELPGALALTTEDGYASIASVHAVNPGLVGVDDARGLLGRERDVEGGAERGSA